MLVQFLALVHDRAKTHSYEYFAHSIFLVEIKFMWRTNLDWWGCAVKPLRSFTLQLIHPKLTYAWLFAIAHVSNVICGTMLTLPPKEDHALLLQLLGNGFQSLSCFATTSGCLRAENFHHLRIPLVEGLQLLVLPLLLSHSPSSERLMSSHWGCVLVAAIEVHGLLVHMPFFKGHGWDSVGKHGLLVWWLWQSLGFTFVLNRETLLSHSSQLAAQSLNQDTASSSLDCGFCKGRR